MAWVIQRLREAMPFGIQPTYLLRDNDAVYGDEVGRFPKGTGIEEVRTAFRCPWQNPFVESYVGILRRELLDHVLVLNSVGDQLVAWLEGTGGVEQCTCGE
jgi:hypothetical protein